MWQALWSMVSLVPFGGGITVIGGIIGLGIGFSAAASCTNACGYGAFSAVCLANCPQPEMFAVYGAIPGIIIGIIEWIVKKS